MIACTKNVNTDTKAKDNTIVWEKKAATSLVMFPFDTNIVNWTEMDKICQHNDTVFSTFKRGVLSGKLKAYKNYPKEELSINAFKNIVERWDSTHFVEDFNKPGTKIIAPIHIKIFGCDISRMRFHETIEIDTVNFSLTRKVSFVSFDIDSIKKLTGESLGYKHLFDIKFNDIPVTKQ